MNKYIKHFFVRMPCFMLFSGSIFFFPLIVQASTQNGVMHKDPAYHGSLNILPVKFLLAEAEQSVDSADKEHTPGQLVIPGEDDNGSKQKKCMTVCKQWGEDCVINPRTGSRKCRRACKRFGEECF